MYVCATCVPGVHRSEKRASSPWEWGYKLLKAAMSVLKIKLRFSARAARSLKHLSSLLLVFLLCHLTMCDFFTVTFQKLFIHWECVINKSIWRHTDTTEVAMGNLTILEAHTLSLGPHAQAMNPYYPCPSQDVSVC